MKWIHERATAVAFCLMLATANLWPTISPATAEKVSALRVRGPDGGESLLLGTMHQGDRRLTQPSAALLDGHKRLVVETRPDQPPPSLSPERTLDPAVLRTLAATGTLAQAPWVQELSPWILQAVRERLACQVPPSNLDLLVSTLFASRPWLTSYAVARPCPEPGIRSRDDILLEGARERGLPVEALETPDEVAGHRDALMAEAGDRPFIEGIKHAVGPDGDALIATFADALNRGDYDAVLATSRRFADTPSAADAFQRHMATNRNLTWLPRLVTLLRGGGAVVLVGAAHLPGPSGLIALLRRSGYDVEPTTVPAALR